MHHPDRTPGRGIRRPLRGPALPPPARRGVSNGALALIALLASALALALTWFPIRSPAAQEAVRSFLEEVRAGEVEAALGRLETAPSGPFLVPEALNADWEIVEVAQVGYEGGADGARSAEVYAEIRSRDGTRLAHRYEVVFEEHEPRIADGLAEGGLRSLGALEANGVAGPASEVVLLPGVYHFRGSPAAAIVEVGMPSVLVLGAAFVELGGERPVHRLNEPVRAFTEEGAEIAAEALRLYLDACEVFRNRGCPFGRLAEGHLFVEADRSERWRITEYPAVVPEGWSSPEAVRLMTLKAGSVEFEAVPVGGGADPITVSCAFGVDHLYLAIEPATGEVTVGWETDEPPACEWLSG